MLSAPSPKRKFSLVNRTCFICHIFEEVKIRIMPVSHPVCTGKSHHGSGKFSIAAVFIRKPGSVKGAPDLLVTFIVVTPLKPGLPALNEKPQINRYIIHGDTCVQKFGLLPVFQMNNGYCALSQGFAVIFSKVNIIHVVVIKNQPGAVLMDFGNKFHLCGNPRIDAGQFPCKDADTVQRRAGFLSPDSHVTRP